MKMEVFEALDENIRNIARKMSRNTPTDAEDLYQEGWLRACMFEDCDNIGFLTVSATNAMKDYARKCFRHTEHVDAYSTAVLQRRSQTDTDGDSERHRLEYEMSSHYGSQMDPMSEVIAKDLVDNLPTEEGRILVVLMSYLKYKLDFLSDEYHEIYNSLPLEVQREIDNADKITADFILKKVIGIKTGRCSGKSARIIGLNREYCKSFI